jgi:hypothetical protein
LLIERVPAYANGRRSKRRPIASAFPHVVRRFEVDDPIGHWPPHVGAVASFDYLEIEM